ncbi:MAG TPA: class II D-tagatose-bisphosphate aldolase, non-catalytic subunit [Rubrobacter sp.]
MEEPVIKSLVQRVKELQDEDIPITLLAVCPNSDAVLEAAIEVAARTLAPMLFATTLNQVDRDGGYTGWTPKEYVARMGKLAEKHGCVAPLYPCLDHGGPWLKDAQAKLGLAETMDEVKASITACLEAGYSLLHVDPTVDPGISGGEPLDVRIVVKRTVELMEHAEAERKRLGIGPVAYEVGTEEVAGGLANMESFESFVRLLREALEEKGLMQAWPAFVVGKVGTDLHTTLFDPEVAKKLRAITAQHGSLVKGHYTDWVDNPEAYPTSGMGGANVGPEFTTEEAEALWALCDYEAALARSKPLTPSRFFEALTDAVDRSGRWRKWLQPNEPEEFEKLSAERRRWLVTSGARYVWTQPQVVESRSRLYENLTPVMGDPHGWVVGRIAASIEKYVRAFNLFGSAELLGLSEAYAGRKQST